MKRALLGALAACALLLPQPHSDAAFSGRNGRIVVGGCGGCEGSDQSELYTIEPNGDDLTRITHNRRWDSTAEFSPNGRRIVFVCHGSFRVRSPGREICISKPDGSDRRKVMDNDVVENDPTWSPDGKQIAFIRNYGSDSEIWIVDVDGTDERQVTNNDFPEFDTSWSPLGDEIAFVTSRGQGDGIYAISPDGLNERQLTDTAASEGGVEWSPDGSMITFDRNVDPPGRPPPDWYVFIKDLESGEETRVVAGISPTFSPDGRLLAFIDNAIYRIRVDGTRRFMLRDSDEVLFSNPDWQPLP